MNSFPSRSLGVVQKGALLAPAPLVKSPYSIQLNGTSQSINLAFIPVNPNADFTIEGWIKLTANATSNVVFGTAQDTNNYWALIVRNDGSGLCFQCAFNSGTATFIGASAATIAVADGWTHVAVTRTGNLYSFYKNGVLLKSATQAGSFMGGASAIGRLLSPFTTGVEFAGYVYDIRVWDIAKSEGQIFAAMKLILPPQRNLKGYWRMKTSTGVVISDDSGYGNVGQLAIGPTISTDIPF